MTNEEPSEKELDLRHALRAALTHNQNDSSLLPEWMSLLERSPARFIGGPRDGFDGFVELPTAPSYKIVNQALKCMRVYLQDDPRKAQKYRVLAREAFDRFPLPIKIVYEPNWSHPSVRTTEFHYIVTVSDKLKGQKIAHDETLRQQVTELSQEIGLVESKVGVQDLLTKALSAGVDCVAV